MFSWKKVTRLLWNIILNYLLECIFIQNTSLAAKGALANRLQRRTACKIQNGRQGAHKWLTGSGNGCTPRWAAWTATDWNSDRSCKLLYPPVCSFSFSWNKEHLSGKNSFHSEILASSAKPKPQPQLAKPSTWFCISSTQSPISVSVDS